MNWITVSCSMIAASCLTIGGIHLLAWLRLRRAWTSLLLANLALTSAVFVGCHVAIMQVRTPDDALVLLRWTYVPLSWALVSLVLFIRQYLGTGRDWLLGGSLVLRGITLVVNFLVPGSLILQTVTAIQPVTILGEQISVPMGMVSPWMVLGNLSAALFVVYLVDASVTAWRQGSKRPALVVAGLLVPALLVALVRAVTVSWGGPSLPSPFLVSLLPLGAMLVMSFALSGELLRAEVLARELRESHERMGAAASELDRVSRLTAMGEFAAALAHETVQPITAMILEAKSSLYALDGNGTGVEDARTGLRSIVESGQRAAQVIQRNRELFRHRTVRTVPLKINEVIAESRSLAGWRLHDSNVSIDMALTSGLPAVSGDRVELQQVLLNLIGNALDAVESRPNPRVWIRTSEDGDGACVEVGDNGVGLGDVDTGRMFSLSYTTKPNGTGVGLAVSRAIVDAHGGRIWAETNAEGGASFFFSLPRRDPRPDGHEDPGVSRTGGERLDVGKAAPDVPDTVAYPHRLEREIERVVDSSEIRRGDRA
jgi:signal transduction histidine kinase